MLPIIQLPSLRRFEVQRDLAALIVLVCACSFPFLGQPFHMDDNFYIDVARNARINPWFPYDTPYVFEGQSVPDIASHSHPPLQAYVLAFIQSVVGEGQEWIYHLCALTYPLLAVVAMYFLAARFVERPLWPCMGLAVAPVFQVMQHNLMTDLPTLAFWLAAIACHLWAIDLNRNHLYVASSLFQFAAIFTSYQAVAIVPLLAFYQWRRGKGALGWIALCAPLLLMASWFGMNYVHYHRFILGDTAGYIQSRNSLTAGTMVTKLVAVLQYQGWLILFPVFPLYLFARGLRGRLLALAVLASLYLAQILPPDYRLVEKAIFIVGLITGAFLLIHMMVFFVQTMRDKQQQLNFDRVDGQFLGLWYLGVVAYCLCLFTEGSARYILPLVPPVLLYFFKVLEVMEVREYRQKRPPLMGSAMTATGALVLSLAWGLLLSHADLEFARVYPRAATEVSRIAEGARVYYGGEWGFRYYLHQAGALQLPMDETEVRGGSLVAYPRLASSYFDQTPRGLRDMLIPFETLEYSVRTPLRLLDRRSHAGFYSTGWGLLPFSLSRNPVETIEIRQVNFMIERLPWAQFETRAGEKPWPGYLSDQDQSPAILVPPGTRLLYPWTEENPRRLELKCGIRADSVKAGSTFEFVIRQLDAHGRILAECSKTLSPGSRKEDRGWQPLALELRGRAEGGETLEFRYSSSEEEGIGAFALARLSGPRR